MIRSTVVRSLRLLALVVALGCSPAQTPLSTLLLAIDAEDLAAATDALAQGPDLEPNCAPYQICKPLARAAGRGNFELVKLLIESGADPNGKNAYDDTAFIVADNAITVGGRTQADIDKIRRYLIEQGTDVNQPNAFAITPFIGICISGDLEMAKLALEHGADVNAAFTRSVESTEPDRNSALMWASLKGNATIVSFLLENGADPHYTNDAGETAKDWAEKSGNDETISILASALNE